MWNRIGTALGLLLLLGGATGVAAQGTEKARVPPRVFVGKPLSEIEPPRNVRAEDYKSFMCLRWKDGCTQCEQLTLNSPRLCYPKAMKFTSDCNDRQYIAGQYKYCFQRLANQSEQCDKHRIVCREWQTNTADYYCQLYYQLESDKTFLNAIALNRRLEVAITPNANDPDSAMLPLTREGVSSEVFGSVKLDERLPRSGGGLACIQSRTTFSSGESDPLKVWRKHRDNAGETLRSHGLETLRR